ncbi:28S ribosomal protein S18c, mitochondrial isoform X2 [Rhincodon typus]|uniref:28S ribosomal protein S18c, mitochondrial isoform X2 n=1 Tax=Rhincodon typus TaxID=259920 RepID=UPI0009A2DE4B|nr:28S ribosomal protein S18c, mitochondrial isoform X2 [Rhincodon typus]
MLRALRKWRPVYWQKGISTQHIPSISNTSDMPIKLENPYKEPPRKCILCGVPVDYKNVQLLSQFISPYTGRIFGRHITGLCGKKQKQISKAIKKAQQMGFMSVTFKDPAFLKDPNICDFKLRE